MTDRELMQQALEALDWHVAKGAWGADIEGVAAELRERLSRESTHSDDCWRWHHECAVSKLESLAQPKPTPAWWRDGLTATLMREGVNKHRAREIADGYWEAYLQIPGGEDD